MKNPTDSQKNNSAIKLRKGKNHFGKNTLFFFPIIVTLFCFGIPSAGSGASIPAPPSSAVVAHPLTHLDDGKAKHFQYKTANGKTIRYFIVKSPDGKVRAAFDACDVCWPSGKGYVQEGNFMICRNCGQKFPTSQVNVVTGGCNPAALNRQTTKTHLILQVKDILEGQKYFNF